jgi:hypothetical protein
MRKAKKVSAAQVERTARKWPEIFSITENENAQPSIRLKRCQHGEYVADCGTCKPLDWGRRTR